MSEKSSDGLSLPARILLRAILNMGSVWFLATKLDAYFHLTGGVQAYVIVGSLLTLMNLFVRPVLAIVTFPLKLFATLLAIIIVNGVFVQLVDYLVQRMQPELVTLHIYGGLWGWIVVAVVLGVGNWVMRVVTSK